MFRNNFFSVLKQWKFVLVGKSELNIAEFLEEGYIL